MPTVLIADDDHALRRVMGRFLRAENWTVFEAENVRLAVDLYASTPTDVVVTDLLMPQLDGIGVVVQLRALDPQVPVIVLTGHGTVERCREALKVGAADFLLKPCEPDEFLAALGRAYQTRLDSQAGSRQVEAGSRRLDLCVVADMAQKPGVLNRVESNALDMGYGRRSWSIRLALDEAFVNAVVHGAKGDPTKEIHVTATFGVDEAAIEITDPGEGFSPPMDEPAFPTGEGGRGLFLLRSFCDRVEWTDRGRTCRMIFGRKASRPGVPDSAEASS